MNKETFTWIPFYTELASNLLKFKNRRKELAKLIYSNFDRKDIRFLHDGDGSDFKEIDPFTVYSIFNRKMKNRAELVQIIKELFDVKAKAPIDFDGIPVQSPMNASFITFTEDRSQDGKDVDRLWKLFEQAQDEGANLSKVFNATLKQHSIAIPKLTMGLYYIRPYHFMALDGNNREYLKKYGFDDWDFQHLDYSEYEELLELVSEKMKQKSIIESSFPEFSANAYIGGVSSESDSNLTTRNNMNIINLLKANNNLILTGAPGTGKTHLAKEIAKGMGAEVGFVQFHPSYDYTDFVEGMRPVQDKNGNVGFERRDGVFKSFCKKALMSQDDALYQDAIDRFKKDIAKAGTMTIMTSKTSTPFKISLNSRNTICVVLSSDDTWSATDKNLVDYLKTGLYDAQHDTYLHSIGDYIRKTYLPDDIGYQEEGKKSFVFIIDEINRGEISKIFGELFFSIDPGYRGEEGKVDTQYQNMIEEGDVFKKGFYVPDNVYIIGTMNDIDRSVESMDFAMRRRFAWKEITAEESYEAMKDCMIHAEEVKKRMSALNDAICDEKLGLNKSYQIGAAYFLKLNDYDGDFDKLWEYHLRGLLFEYLRGNRDAEQQLEKLKKAYDGETESQNG